MFDGSTSSALTPAFLRELYGTAADELLADPADESPKPAERRLRRVEWAAAA